MLIDGIYLFADSRLANKLFDPCRVTGGDNGMTLPYQYRSALDTLTPKLNEKIAKAKNQLRELLLTPYPCLLYTSPSPRDRWLSRMPSSA